jgi:hypothetical protein
MARKMLLAIVAMMLIAAAALPPLAFYSGKYPFDKIRGYTFVSHPFVRAAMTRAVWSKTIRDQVLSAGVAGPISQSATLMVAHSCEPHNCGDHNWTIVIVKPRGPAAVCYHDQELTDSSGRWFVDGQARYVSADGCSDTVTTIPSQVIAHLARLK